MNITIVHPHFLVRSGSSNVIFKISHLLVEKGYNITIVTRKVNFSENLYPFDKKINIIEFLGPSLHSPFFWLNSKLPKRVGKIIESTEPDIIWVHAWPSLFWVANNKNLIDKIIWHCHEPSRELFDKEWRKNYPFLERFGLLFLTSILKRRDLKYAKLVNKITTNSQFTGEKVTKIYGKESDVIYWGLDTKIFHCDETLYNKDSNEVLVFCPGIVFPNKGTKQILELFNRTRNHSPKLIFLVDGTENQLNFLEKGILKSTFQHEMILLGHLSPQELIEYYNKSDIILYPSINESYGLIPLEAMALKKPVIAFSGGPSETIIHNKTGFICENESVDQMVEYLLKLSDNSDLRKEFGENGRANVMQNFSWENTLTTVTTIFNKFNSNN